MRYVSLFSGVEAASVAWEPIGWTPVAFAEVEEFPCAVLAERFPDVPNLGDVTKINWKEFHERNGAIDVLVGGSPCQSFSIAGNREGLAGESGLMFEYIRAVRELVSESGGAGPRYILWENVPGALSSERGVAFGQLLAELDELGYGLAWRVLDAQFARVPDRSAHGFFGPVPQRRRRVFLVGVLGSPHAAEILFERSCLSGDHPKGREAREALAEHLEGCSGMGDSAGFKYHQGSGAGSIGFESEQSPTIMADYHNPAVLSFVGEHGGNTAMGMQDDNSPTITKQHVPSVLTPWDVQSKRVYSQDGTSPCLQSGSREGGSIQPVVLQGGGTTSLNSHGSGYETDGACYTLNNIDRHAVAFAQNTRDEVRLFGGDGDTVGALAAQPGMKQQSYVCMSSGQANAEIREDGGGAEPHLPARVPDSRTSNGEDVFPALCATDGSKQFIDNQSIDGGRLIIESGYV